LLIIELTHNLKANTELTHNLKTNTVQPVRYR
jgi:hypothetical protein